MIEPLIFLITTTTLLHSKLTKGNWRTIQLFIPMTALGLIVDNIVVLNNRLSYGACFTVFVFNVPLCIGLGWGAAVYSSMELANLLFPRIKEKAYRPLIYGILGTSLDLITEPIADRCGWWRWPEDGYLLGGPPRNYIGWLLNITLFSTLFLTVTNKNWSENKKTLALLASAPPLATLIVITLKLIGILLP